MSFCTISYSCFKSYYYQIIKVDMDSKKIISLSLINSPLKKLKLNFDSFVSKYRADSKKVCLPARHMIFSSQKCNVLPEKFCMKCLRYNSSSYNVHVNTFKFLIVMVICRGVFQQVLQKQFVSLKKKRYSLNIEKFFSLQTTQFG